MAADTVHLSFDQGDDIDFSLEFLDDQGSAKDITGWTVFATVKQNKSDSDSEAKISKTITTHDDAPNGKTSFQFTSSETKDLSGTYHYDFQYKNAQDKIRTFQKGVVSFDPDVTERES